MGLQSKAALREIWRRPCPALFTGQGPFPCCCALGCRLKYLATPNMCVGAHCANMNVLMMQNCTWALKVELHWDECRGCHADLLLESPRVAVDFNTLKLLIWNKHSASKGSWSACLFHLRNENWCYWIINIKARPSKLAFSGVQLGIGCPCLCSIQIFFNLSVFEMWSWNGDHSSMLFCPFDKWCHVPSCTLLC